ncbi:hypothetical protein AsAng_0008370 [Aureispira anguillae]|uniref:Uncharacterized protein n=1 Tax=Aureispira anguillae TaxID=2864201 RepID=A0A915YBQ6_9BACT|nr:hypothetical protein AsAng_0008370 [Aureispira anguillae]
MYLMKDVLNDDKINQYGIQKGKIAVSKQRIVRK